MLLANTSVTIAFVAFISILLLQLADMTGITQCLKRNCTDLKRHIIANRHIGQANAEVESESDTDSFPDRVINPNGYKPLSHTAQ